MRDEQEMMDTILGFAKNEPKIKAVLLNGSRANPMAFKDKYQDFDVVYVVEEVEPWLNDVRWIDIFGPRIMLQMPETMRYPAKDGNFAFLMLFDDGNRLDLTLMPIRILDLDRLDRMTIVLLDKENRFSHIEPPSDHHFHVKPPTELEYVSCCNNFLWCLQNVAKGIARDQLPYAMDMYDNVVRSELDSMIDWYIGTLTNFSVSVGKMGKYYKRYLPDAVYQKLTGTYCMGNYDHLWNSIFIAIEIFEQMAKDVGQYLNVPYNKNDHHNMVNYLSDFRKNL